MFARSEEPFGVAAQAVLHDYNSGRRGGGGGGDGDGHGFTACTCVTRSTDGANMCYDSVSAPNKAWRRLKKKWAAAATMPTNTRTTVYVNPRAPVLQQLRIEAGGTFAWNPKLLLGEYTHMCKSLSHIPTTGHQTAPVPDLLFVRTHAP